MFSHVLRSIALLAVAFTFVVLCSSADASGRGRHKKLYITPAPGTITVDGKLDDWDLSGQILMYVVPETRDTQSARFAMMYDSEALYISGQVRDTSPMMNRHDPKVDPQFAWDADVCQIYFSLDPDLPFPVEFSKFNKEHHTAPIGTMMLWYFTDRKEPNLAMFRGMRFREALRPEFGKTGVIPHDRFSGAYVKSDDGLGYTFEYRIPFETFGLARKPVANDIMSGTACVFWSRPDGLKTKGGNAWAYDVMATAGFPWQSTACYGKLIFHPEGGVAKELVTEGQPPEKPLPLTFTYDVPEDSEITVQLFDKDNVIRRILVAQGGRPAGTNTERWDGLDDNGKPLPPGEYRWAGIYHEPITQKYRFAAHNSGKPTWPTDDNAGGWGGDHGNPTTVCAIPPIEGKKNSGGMALAWSFAEYGWGIIRTTEAGKKLWGSKSSTAHMATDGKYLYAQVHGFNDAPGVRKHDLKDSRPVTFANGAGSLVPSGGDYKTNRVTGIACHGGRIYVSYGARNEICVFSEAGDWESSYTLDSAGPIAVFKDGSLAVISSGTIARVTETRRPANVNAVQAPEPKNDEEWPPKLPRGAAVRVSIDTKALIDTHLDTPVGVAVDANDNIYVSNQGALQNVSVFSKDGKYLASIGKEGGRPAVGKYDPTGMYMPGGIDIDSQGRLWVAETRDGPKRVSVWDTKTGELVTEYFGASSYFGYGFIDPAKPDEMYAHYTIWKVDWDKNTAVPYSTFWRATEEDHAPAPEPAGYRGRHTVLTANNGRQYAYGGHGNMNIVMRRDGDIFKPFITLMNVNRQSPRFQELIAQAIRDDAKRFPDGFYAWQDADDDQRMEVDEVVSLGKNARAGVQFIDGDLNLWLSDGTIVKPKSVAENGLPVYDFATRQPNFGGDEGRRFRYLWGDLDGGQFYSNTPGAAHSLAGWNSDGSMRWSLPDRPTWHKTLNMPIVKAGRLWGMTDGLGMAGDYTGTMTYFGVCHLFNRDGIYVAAINRDGRTGGAGPDIGQPEGQGGQFVKLRTQADGPDRYFLIAGGQDSRVTEVLGLDTIKPLEGGTYVHTQEAFDTATKAQEDYQQKIAGSRKLTVVRGRKALDIAQPVGKAIDTDRSFEVRAAYDDNNLYLKYDVKSPFDLTTAIADPTLLFKGGNVLDIQLAADVDADPGRDKPAPGDMRILVSQQAGKPIAVAYRAKVKGFEGEGILLTSPTGEERFDVIEKVDVTPTVRAAKTGDSFTATVTIPHTITGLALKPGMRLRMDVGYIFGNKTGSQAAARAYWTNNSFTANVINDIPHESRLEPKEWGEAIVE